MRLCGSSNCAPRKSRIAPGRARVFEAITKVHEHVTRLCRVEYRYIWLAEPKPLDFASDREDVKG